MSGSKVIRSFVFMKWQKLILGRTAETTLGRFAKKVPCKLVLRSSQTVTQSLFYLESKFVNLGFCGVNVRKVKS